MTSTQTPPRRERGEALALVRQALREQPRGLTTKEVAAATGIAQVLCGVLMSNYRALGHVESDGFRPQRWRLADACAPSRAAKPIAVAGSIFDPRPGTRAAIASPGSSRVINAADCYVATDDFSPGAFLRDWQARRSAGSNE